MDSQANMDSSEANDPSPNGFPLPENESSSINLLGYGFYVLTGLVSGQKEPVLYLKGVWWVEEAEEKNEEEEEEEEE